MKLNPFIAFVMPVWACLLHPANVMAEEQVRVLVPPFESQGYLGENVANVLGFQLLGTLSDVDKNTSGVIIFGTQPLKTFSEESAIERALNLTNLAHLVIWGKAYSFSDGVGIQANLSFTPFRLKDANRKHREIWTIHVPSGESIVELKVDLPRQSYSFPAILLSPEAVSEFEKIFEKLVIFGDPALTKQVGTMAGAFRAYQYLPDRAEIESNGVRGWVRLPLGWASQSVVSSFSAAYIRLLRGDWLGAEMLLENIVQSENLNAEIRIDISLLLGLTREMQGKSGVSQFLTAVNENEFDVSAIKYLIMGRVADIMRASEKSDARDEAYGQLVQDLGEYAFLFSGDDEWFRDVGTAASLLKP